MTCKRCLQECPPAAILEREEFGWPRTLLDYCIPCLEKIVLEWEISDKAMTGRIRREFYEWYSKPSYTISSELQTAPDRTAFDHGLILGALFVVSLLGAIGTAWLVFHG